MEDWVQSEDTGMGPGQSFTSLTLPVVHFVTFHRLQGFVQSVFSVERGTDGNYAVFSVKV